MEQQDSPSDEEHHINNEAFWRKLTGIFAQTQVMLREKAEELGIDIETVSSDVYSKIRARALAIIKRDEINDPQSDANGSVKIALIAIERLILAWRYLLTPQNTDTLQPMIELLERINRLAEQTFPNARDFLRPGFDEIETVM